MGHLVNPHLGEGCGAGDIVKPFRQVDVFELKAITTLQG